MSQPLTAALAMQDDRLSNCVHCGFCLPACPTYLRLGDEADSPRGRLHLMRAVVEGRLDPASDAFQTHIDRCLGCRACETVCPSGVEYGLLLERAREVGGTARPRGLSTTLLLSLIRRRVLFVPWMLLTRMLRWTRIPAMLVHLTSGWPGTGRFRLAMAMLAASESWRSTPDRGVHPSRVEDGARTSQASSLDKVDRESRPEPASEPVKRVGRAGLLRGCIQDHLFRRVNEATERVLRANGWEVVEVTGQACCGALHAHAGCLSEAREMARLNIAAFRAAGVDCVVVNAAGCGSAMKEYMHLLEESDPSLEGARWFSGRVRDVSEVLAGDAAIRIGAGLPVRVAYDPPCHLLHGQRVREPPIELLRSIPEVEVAPVPKGDECCGGAGIYGLTHPDLGGRIGADKVDAVLSTRAEVLATGNPGCAMQIGAGLRMARAKVSVAHPVELVDESYRRGGIYGSARIGS